PLDITNIPYFYKIFNYLESRLSDDENVDIKLTVWRDYSILIKAYLILKRLIRSEYFETSAYKFASQLKITKMTIAQQSYSYCEGRLYESQLGHRVIENVYPMMQNSMQLVKTLIDVGKVSSSD
ncbi:16849_t:CDS:1, partial [Acaulospora colombiana]